MSKSREFYSNCLLESLKAKLLSFDDTMIIITVPHILPHFMWISIGSGYINDFHKSRNIKWYQSLFYKGYIRNTDLKVWNRYRESKKIKLSES